MKTRNKFTNASLAFAATLLVGLPQSGHALTLVYETGPQTGQAFTTGQISLKFTGFAVGSVYDFAATPTAGSGVGANPVGTVASGVSALDVLQIQAGPGSSSVQTVINGIGQGLGSVSPEDSWGIARVTEIVDFATGETIWSQAGKSAQLTALSTGNKDFYYNFDAGTNKATVNGVGLRLDLYEVSTAGFPNGSTFNSTFGPLPGHGGDNLGNGSIYAGVTNGAPILSMRSVAGFIHGDGTLGGLKTEFESSLNLSGSGGNGNLGSSFLEVIGGSEAALFNTNSIQSGIVPGLFTDVQIEFTETTFGTNPNGTLKTNPSGWFVAQNDPLTAILGTTSVPEPGTALAGVVCLMIGTLRRRRSALS